METLNQNLVKSKKAEQHATTGKEGAGLVSKFQQFSVSKAKASTVDSSAAVGARPSSSSINRMLKLGSAGPTAFFNKTPKPPTVPRSRSFYQKSQRPLNTGRLGADGEACAEEVNTDDDDDSVDYCSIERLPGDGCVSESTDEFSDGFEEEEIEASDDSEDYNEEICEELSELNSSTSESRPSTASSSRLGSATVGGCLQREKLVKAICAKRHASARSNIVRNGPSKLSSARDGRWTEGGPETVNPCLTNSLFPHVPSTIHFTVEGEKVCAFPSKTRKLLKWKMSTITPNVVKLCIARSGFVATKKNDWLGCWGKHMKAAAFRTVRDFQKVNHFPGSFQIGRKDKLWKNLSKLQARHGKKEFGFIPQTYVLPHDYKNLKRVWDEGGNKQKWILKPPASARGIGIRVIHKWSQIPKKKPVVVQKYLAKPFLINGKKFDLRIYVFISSFDPLRIYVFEEGLTRFATCKYSSSTKSLSNKFMHLTNYSINKKNGDAYIPNNDEEACQGHKWSLKALWGYLKRMGVNTTRIWESIKDIVIKTIISCESTVNILIKQNVRNSYCCHELFGFDVMLDQNLKPWILEVNISPSLHSTSPLDMSIKGQMVRDLLNIAGFRIPSASTTAASMEKERTTLSSDQKAKHGFYVNCHNDENVKGTVLDILTPEDIRILMETEDEFSRRGCFQRIFPSENSNSYLKYFEMPRYRNILLDEWVKKYIREGRKITLGVALLCTYAQRKVHLKPCSSDQKHQWSAPYSSQSSQVSCATALSRSLSAPATARRRDEPESESKVVLPKIKRKVIRYNLSQKPPTCSSVSITNKAAVSRPTTKITNNKGK